MVETPVLIAGGGPVGLTLALDLAWCGVAVTVVARRAEAVTAKTRPAIPWQTSPLSSCPAAARLISD